MHESDRTSKCSIAEQHYIKVSLHKRDKHKTFPYALGGTTDIGELFDFPEPQKFVRQ